MTQLDAYRRDEERESRLASADEQDLFAEMEPDLSEQSWEEPVYLQLVEPVKMGAHILEGDEALSVQEESSTDDPNQAVAKDTSHTYAASTTILSSTSLWSLSITVPPSFAKTPEPTEAVDSKTSEIVHAFVDKLQSDDDERRPFPSVARTASATEATNAPRQSSQSLQQDFRSQTSDSRLSQPSPTLEAPSLDNVRPETQSESSKADKAVESSHAAHSSSSTTPHGAPSSLKSSSSSTPSLVYRTVNNAQQQASASPARRNESRPQIIYTHAHHSTHQPNESIYGTIMKRLLALEVNSTLSTTYFEEQSKIVWDTFRRIEDRLLAMEKTVSYCLNVTHLSQSTKFVYHSASRTISCFVGLCWIWSFTVPGTKLNERS